MVEDLTRARNRLSKFLLRHSRVYRGGTPWTHKHEAWLAAQAFDEPALKVTFGHYRATVLARDAALAAVEADLLCWQDHELFADAVHRLGAYRGVTHMGALTLHAEVCDWRRFGRAASLMGFVGLVPSEYSSGSSTHRGPSHQGRQRSPARPAGRGCLVVSAPSLRRLGDRQTPRRAGA
jgi:transposase